MIMIKIISATSYLLDKFQEKLKKLMDYYNACPQKTQPGQIIKDLINAKSTVLQKQGAKFSLYFLPLWLELVCSALR